MIQIAQTGLIISLSLFLILHLGVLLKVIPYQIVWGGRLKSEKEMYQFETISILLTVFFGFIILLKARLLIIHFPEAIIKFSLWTMMILFFFNTISNEMSRNIIEKKLFAPITLLTTIFSLILALGSKLLNRRH